MTLEASYIRLDQGPRVHCTRPAADPLFISAAKAHGLRVLGIVLSGGDGDGAAETRAITDHGGTVYVQEPRETETPSMPRAAIMADHPDACLPVAEVVECARLFCARSWSI